MTHEERRGMAWTLVCRESIPDDEFAVLRRGDKVTLVRVPMHRVNLGQMTFFNRT
jgi:hypothetical protein